MTFIQLFKGAILFRGLYPIRGGFFGAEGFLPEHYICRHDLCIMSALLARLLASRGAICLLWCILRYIKTPELKNDCQINATMRQVRLMRQINVNLVTFEQLLFGRWHTWYVTVNCKCNQS